MDLEPTKRRPGHSSPLAQRSEKSPSSALTSPLLVKRRPEQRTTTPSVLAVFTNLPDRDDTRTVLVRFSLATDAETDADQLSALLFELGATAIEELDDPADVTELAGRVLLAGFASPRAADVAISQLPDPCRSRALVLFPDDGWFDSWRPYAQAQRAGRHLIVHPPWLVLSVDPPAGPEDLVLEIDPGRAFGSGAHPTTRLVLAELERLIGPHTRVLDLGCGSGVLAIAAARLGAAEVLAVDIDPEALTATRENQVRNGVHFPVRKALGAPPQRPRFDVIAANIGANTLIDLAPTLTQWGHTLVLSGFFLERGPEVAAVFARYGALNCEVLSGEDGWTALTMTSDAKQARFA